MAGCNLCAAPGPNRSIQSTKKEPNIYADQTSQTGVILSSGRGSGRSATSSSQKKMADDEEKKVKPDPRANFDWSLKPVILALNGLGIPLDVTGKTSPNVRLAILLLGCFTLTINVTLHLMSFSVTVGNFINCSANENATRSIINYGIGHAVHGFFVAGVQLAFVVVVLFTDRWKDVWDSLQVVQNEMNLGYKFHFSTRIQCIIALALISMVGL